ncbi:MAG TPA: GNAT family N-acetyltransferase [Polyangia bacterium]|jgi:CelD/BcsL family acetyltransferase involved in cellulose biosynthesis|nr:GNAT family N-acetyltransferase [Polyangia bacterium]
MSALAIEIIRSVEALAARESAWWHLAGRASAATPFQTPAWLLAWWRHLGHGQLAAIAVREGDQLLALLPLAVVGEGAQRRLAWVGAGISDYLTALVDDARADEAWPHVERGLRELVAEIGRARLENVPEGDPLLGRLSSPHQPWRHRRSEDAICLWGELPDAHEIERHPRVSAKARAATRRLARLGPVTFTSFGADEIARHSELRVPLLESLFELHTREWRARGEDGVLAAPSVRAHHREAAEALGRRGALRLHALSHGGETIGVVYAFVFRARLWMYLGGFSPAHARFSPGSILIEHTRRAARADGALAMDFLRGEEAYKYRWGVRVRRTFCVELERAG